jgi:peptidase inhibitor family I36
MTTKTVLLVALFALNTSFTASAQRWGRDEFPRDGVCFYKDADFRGDYFCLRSGDSFDSLPRGMNDEISSFRVFGRAEVTVYKDARFDGRSSRFDYDVRNLKDEGWNDLISSIEVRYPSRGSQRPGGGYPGSGSGASRGSQDPDRIVRRAYEDVLDREPDQAGLRLYRSRIIDEGWTEAQVREALRNSPEYREKNTMTPAKAEEIVRRAYLSVLKREPDPGSRTYVDRVLREKWSQADVERDLRKSPEYRNKKP